MPVYRLDLSSGEVRERKRTPQGGLVADASLTRTGVFPYRNEDGSQRMELRHPDEVFHPDSLATYPLAPVTVDHPGRVGPDNWRDHAVGTVGKDVRRDGSYVHGELHLQDGKTIERALKGAEEPGALREISCGYHCDLDPTPGDYQGQHYDAVQRNIRINHVAVGPPGWGRMGAGARMHLDSGAAVSGEPVTAKEYASLAAAAEEDSKAATEASNDAARARTTAVEQGAHGKPGSLTAEEGFHRSQVHERTAGEHHARAVRRHVLAAAAADGAGDDGSTRHHKRFAAMHAHQVLQHAKNANGAWDHKAHPLADYEALAKDGMAADHAEKGAAAGTYVRPVPVTATTEAHTMTEEERKALEKLQADLAEQRARADKLEAKQREDAGELTKLRAENDMLKLQSESAKQDSVSAEERAKSDRKFRDAVRETVALHADARMVFATADDPAGAKWEPGDKGADHIRRDIVKHLEPRATLVYDGKDLEGPALLPVYQLAIGRKRELDKQQAEAQAASHAAEQHEDGAGMGGEGDDDGDAPGSADKARKDMVNRKRDAWKKNKKDAKRGKAA
jgi:hypothetical protein